MTEKVENCSDSQNQGTFSVVDCANLGILFPSSLPYTQNGFFTLVNQAIPMRPIDISFRHFDLAKILNLYTEFQKVNFDHGISRKINLSFYSHRFKRDPDKVLFPWSCWISLEVNQIPVGLKAMSTSGFIIKSNQIDFDAKCEHLRETLLPILKKNKFDHHHFETSWNPIFKDLREYSWRTGQGN